MPCLFFAWHLSRPSFSMSLFNLGRPQAGTGVTECFQARVSLGLKHPGFVCGFVRDCVQLAGWAGAFDVCVGVFRVFVIHGYSFTHHTTSKACRWCIASCPACAHAIVQFYKEKGDEVMETVLKIMEELLEHGQTMSKPPGKASEKTKILRVMKACDCCP